MPKRSSKKFPKKDENEIAASIIGQITANDSGKNPAAVALGRLGGLKGGPARDLKLSKARKRAIAKKAAKARWNKKK